ncbi:MAG: exo-alpha-sialidase [Clostridia bacterium]|nr:exo-alpha-sialidase [Clostridia bacterium]
MRLEAGKETVIVQGIRPEEQLWGAYQFPRPYNIDGKLYVSVHVTQDTMKNTGEPTRWFESTDNGESWSESVDAAEIVASRCGLLLPSGDRLYFPLESGMPLTDYKIPGILYNTPGVDFTKQAEEGTLPIHDGMTFWFDGTVIRAYRAERLPPSLAKKEWKAERIKKGESTATPETVKVNWDCLTRVVYSGPNYKNIMKPIYPRGTPKLGPDGAIWVAAFSGEGHINPENGLYTPYYSAELFRSSDNGHTFEHHAHMEYPADGTEEYPYASGGFSDSDFEFMPDGSMIWVFRSTWALSVGKEWAPMYISRSEDMGKTWTKPKIFTPMGVLPRFVTLGCGATLICYARPGTYVRMCTDKSGKEWSEPYEIMTAEDRSSLHNLKIETPNFHEWVGSCNNPELLPLDDRSALIFYTDFYYPDKDGVKRKTVLCRKITVTD